MEKKEIYKLDGENDSQYILRICSMKEQEDWTWQDIADILNNALGHNYCESAYRKKFQQFNKMLHDNEDTIFNDDQYVKQIDQKKFEIEKERQKLYATKTELQRIIRQNSRFELFYENIKNAIETLPTPCLRVNNYNVQKNNKEYVLTIADIQAGANFSLQCNTYSLDECQYRFEKLLKYTISYVFEHQISKLHVVELGDTIQGILRVTDLQLNETSVVQSTVFIARIIALFLNKLSEYCIIDYYHTPTSNHTQTRPLGTKASEIACEDIEYVIGNYIKDMLRLNSRVEVHTNFGEDYINIPIFNFNIIAMHGHTIKNLETALKDMSASYRKLIDYIIIGHWHNGKIIPGNEHEGHDTELLMCPSFQGTDPYAFNKLGKSSKAACKIFIFDEQYGCVGTEKIILN